MNRSCRCRRICKFIVSVRGRISIPRQTGIILIFIYTSYQSRQIIICTNNRHSGRIRIVYRIIIPRLHRPQKNITNQQTVSKSSFIPPAFIYCLHYVIFGTLYIIHYFQSSPSAIRTLPVFYRRSLRQFYRCNPTHISLFQRTIANRPEAIIGIRPIIHQRPGFHCEHRRRLPICSIKVRQSQTMTELMAKGSKSFHFSSHHLTAA